MSTKLFIPQVWSARLTGNLEKSLVFGDIANRDYEGEISAYGDTVNIGSIGAVTIGDYARSVTAITPEELTGVQTQLQINQAKYFAFKVDDVDKAQQNPKIMDGAMLKAAHALRDAADQHIAGLHAEAGITLGSSTTPIDVASKDVIEVLAQLSQLLTENDNPTDNRFIVIPPWFHTKLVLAKVLVESDNTLALTNGFVGRIMGFDVYVSNNVKQTGNAKYKIMAGVKGSISFAQQLLSVEAYRPEASFSDAVKGLYVFGAKTTEPKSLVTLTANPKAEV